MSGEGDLLLQVVSADGDEFPVLQRALSNHSDYFKGLFNSGMREVAERKVVLPTISTLGLSLAVRFIETGTVDLSLADISHVLGTSTYLQMTTLTEFCARFLKNVLSVRNAMVIHDLAAEFGLKNIQSETNSFILESMNQITKTDSFKNADLDRILYLLDNDNANACREYDLFEAAIAWLRHKNLLEDNELVGEILKTLRFPLMTLDDLKECNAVLNSVDVENAEELISFESTKEYIERGRSSSVLAMDRRFQPRCQKTCLLAFGGFTGTEQSTNRTQLVTLDELKATTAEVGFRCSRVNQSSMKLPKPVCEHCVVQLNGFIYVAGGQSQYCLDGRYTRRNVYRLDQWLGIWQEVCPMEKPRSLFYVGSLGGTLYAVGGWTGPDTVTRSVERYIPSEDKWQFVASLDVGLHEHAGTAHNGLLYISGGFKGPYRGHINKVWSYDPAGDVWTARADMVHARSYHAMVSAGHHLLIAGGVKYIGHDTCEDVRECELYDPDTDQWTVVSRVPRFASCMSSVTVDSKLHLFGGHSFETGTDHRFLQTYDFSSRQWTEKLISSHKINFYACLVSDVPRNILNQFK